MHTANLLANSKHNTSELHSVHRHIASLLAAQLSTTQVTEPAVFNEYLPVSDHSAGTSRLPPANQRQHLHLGIPWSLWWSSSAQYLCRLQKIN